MVSAINFYVSIYKTPFRVFIFGNVIVLGIVQVDVKYSIAHSNHREKQPTLLNSLFFSFHFYGLFS